ncbi:hypothetical protein KCU76_g78, partial [Aureobasidium melanogenum]
MSLRGRLLSTRLAEMRRENRLGRVIRWCHEPVDSSVAESVRESLHLLQRVRVVIEALLVDCGRAFQPVAQTSASVFKFVPSLSDTVFSPSLTTSAI